MDEVKLAEKVPEGIDGKPETGIAAAAGAAASLPVGTIHVGTVRIPGAAAAEPILAVPFDALDKTIGTFERLCSIGGKAIFRNRMKGRLGPKLHTMVGRLSLL